MTILAIWFGVAVVVGLLLGYAARQLKSASKGQPHTRKTREANAEDGDSQRQFTSSKQFSIKTNKFYRKIWRI